MATWQHLLAVWLEVIQVAQLQGGGIIISSETEKEYEFVGSDPQYAAECPLCQEEEIHTKYVGFDLYEHLNGKCHTKSNLAGFLSQEACYNRFWEDE